jgi:hypothetical protein
MIKISLFWNLINIVKIFQVNQKLWKKILHVTAGNLQLRDDEGEGNFKI